MYVVREIPDRAVQAVASSGAPALDLLGQDIPKPCGTCPCCRAAKAKKAKYAAEYNSRTEVKAKRAEYQKKYFDSPKGRAAYARGQAKYFATETGMQKLRWWNEPSVTAALAAGTRKLPPWLKIEDGKVVPLSLGWPQS